jgi:arylsulfatase A-like enzyme
VVAGLLGAVVSLATLLGCGTATKPQTQPHITTRPTHGVPVVPTGSPKAYHPRTALGPGRPNIVFVLMDDFSSNLLKTMPNAKMMTAEGAYLPNTFVTDSMCCVSRSSIFTGQYPHQTHVLTNTPGSAPAPIGGYESFQYHHDDHKSFSLDLQKQGYRTGFIGKYLNGYAAQRNRHGVRRPPPGWSSWQAVLEGGYSEWGYRYTTVRDGRIRLHREPVTDTDRGYATRFMAGRAVRFIRAHRHSQHPYFLEVATYGTHSRVGHKAHADDPIFPPAISDRPNALNPSGNCGAVLCTSLNAPAATGFNDDVRDNTPVKADGQTARPWQSDSNKLLEDPRNANRQLRNRARMAQSIDRLLARVRAAVGPNTYIFLSSDNGFHIGQHRLKLGKGTPYNTDARVPMVVVGPKVVPGQRPQMVSDVDLASTFEQIAGRKPAAYRSGRSFLPVLRRPDKPGDRYVFMEHTYARSSPGAMRFPDPDDDSGFGGTTENIPSYVAIRSRKALLVRFDLDDRWKQTSYAYELYRYGRMDGYERTNEFAQYRNTPWVHQMMRRLDAYAHCDPAQCRRLTR